MKVTTWIIYRCCNIKLFILTHTTLSLSSFLILKILSQINKNGKITLPFLKNLQQFRKATQVSAWVARSLLLAVMNNNCGNCVLENNVFYPIRVDYTNSIIVFPSNLDIRHPETVHQKYSYSPRNFSDNSSHFFVHSFLFFVFLRSTYLL